ncbi:MAG TPA: hypothetical protein VJ746_15860 [Nitrospira sp.]|nr:hypothetical protein [Nitrospira sp.]
MWADPDSGLPFEEILRKIWRALPPNVQAEYQDVMAATGQTWEEMVRQAHTRFLKLSAAAQNDPHSSFARALDFLQFPRGHDPWLK